MTSSMSALVPAGQEPQRFLDPLRGIAQALPLGIFTDLPQHLGDQILHPAIVPHGVFGLWWVLLSAGAARGQDADALYANRAVLADAKKAAALWQTRIDRDAKDFEAAWKRARAGYWIGGHEKDQSERDRAYEQAMAAARVAIAARPDAPEGHFWLAANMGGYAEDHGIRGGLKYRGDIRARSRRPSPSIRHSFRARPIARSGAGTTRFRACSAAASASPRSICARRSPTTLAASFRTSFSPRRSKPSTERGSDRRAQTGNVFAAGS